MKIRNTPSGFTLVELIVVIVIIAIVWTLGFISLTWYTQLANNSKISSDMRTIVSSIESELAKWGIAIHQIVETPYLSHSVDNNIATFWSVSLWGSGVVIDETSNYSVWSIGFKNLKQNPSDFRFTLQDNIERQYLSAYVSSWDYARYQIWWSTILPSGEYKSMIKWNYKDEGGLLDVDWLISESGALSGILPEQILLSGVLNPSIEIVQGGWGWWGGGWGGGATPWLPWAIAPYVTWTALLADIDISLPESASYNVFEVDASANNSDITIEVWDENTTITTQQGDDQITAWYGNNLINASNGNNIITVWDGYNEINVGYHDSIITVWNGNNTITSLGGSVTVNSWDGDNDITLWYGATLTVDVWNGDNTILGTWGGAFVITMWTGNNSITASGFGNHNITLGNGNNTFSGAWGNSIVTTGTGGSAEITFWWNQSQQLIWRWGDVVLNDFWRWWNNSISFSQISDLNNCTDVSSNTVMSWSIATITSTHGTLEVHIQQGHTDYNCSNKMIF